MSQRAQLKHMLLDSDFDDKPVFIDLEANFGPLATLWYIKAQAKMSRATDAQVSRVTLRVIGERIGLKAPKISELIDYCLDNEMLVIEGESVSSPRVIKDQEALWKTQEKWREKKRNPKRFPGELPGDSTEKSEDIEVLKIEDLKNNGHTLTLPKSFDSPELLKLVQNWQLRLAKHNRTLDQIGLEALIIRFQTPEKFRAALVHTLSLSKALNVIDPPDKTPRFYNGKPDVKPRPNISTVSTEPSDYVPPNPEISARNKKLLGNLLEKVSAKT